MRIVANALLKISRYCLAAMALGATLSSAAPSIRIAPGPAVLNGEPVHVSVVGASPGTEVKLTAERWFAGLSVQRASPRLMRSEAVFTADKDGRVDLRTAEPLRGSYRGADARGLFWSMQPVAGVERAAAGTVDTSEVRFRLNSGDAKAEASVRLLPALPAVRVQAAEGLPGAVFAVLPGEHKRPAVILLGGSEGGSLITLDAAPYASHGFAVLALPVYSPPDRKGAREIPELSAAWADMPVETLNKARDWLARQPDVDATRIAVHGTSMGALLALLGAAHLPWVSGVVANVPSDVVWDGWGPGVELGKRSTFSVGGKPLPFIPLMGYEEEMRGYERNEPVIMRRTFERGRIARPDLAAKARVPVERIRAPVMVIGAYDDQMWPSGQMAQNIVERRAETGLETEALLYREAGHSLYDTGYSPTTGYNAGLRKSGGTPEANAKAQAEVWPRTIQFLKRVLRVEAVGTK
jgi:dienelactone hydrolase